MKRIHLFDFTDQSWYPQTFRRIQTDYLQLSANLGSGHKNLVPLLIKALQHAGTHEIIDLCSGGGGPWIRLKEQLAQAGWPVSVKLTDQYPNPDALQKWAVSQRQGIEYQTESIDALNVPVHLQGMRTLFEGFHHFRPEQARSILQDAVEQRAAIGIFDASFKQPLRLLMLLLSPLITLLAYLLATPFLKPRTPARFLWTYLIPIVPLATCWDGIISMLRVYSPAELHELIELLQRQDYTWETGLASTGTPVFTFTYLLGYPLDLLTDADHRAGQLTHW
jgi:hypothetical protein